MIDIHGRQRLAQERQTSTLVQGMKDSIVAAIQNNVKTGGNENEEVLKLVVKREEDKELVTIMNKIAQAIVLIYNNIPKSINLPRIFQVQGKVDIGRVPPIEIDNFKDLGQYFHSLEQKIGGIATAISMIPQSRVEIPKLEIPKDLFKPISDNKDVLEALQRLEKVLEKSSKGKVEFPEHISVDNFPPVLTPQPVTHISINALQGFIKTTAATVTSTLTLLPSYGVLANRRSVYVYNNSSNTIYVGGSDVTTSNGMVVPAGATSPIVDAGVNTRLYGIASTGSNDIRVMEVSDEASGR